MDNISAVHAYQGLNIIEWELCSRLCSTRIPLVNKVGFSSTLLPNIVFAGGIDGLGTRGSITCIGLGFARNLLQGRPKRVFGLLQRFGAASLLVNLYGDSPVAPLLGVGLWNLVAIYLAKDPKLPFKSPSDTGQTALDRKVVGANHMLCPEYDPDGLLATLMTSVSMWFGRWYSNSLTSSNDSFITGLSMMSLGYMCCYAFPQLYPFSQTFWTFSYALGTSGFSLVKLTLTRMLCRALSQYTLGSHMLWYLTVMGRHAAKLFLVSTILDQSSAVTRVQSMAQGWKGKVLASMFKNTALLASALLFNRIFI